MNNLLLAKFLDYPFEKRENVSLGRGKGCLIQAILSKKTTRLFRTKTGQRTKRQRNGTPKTFLEDNSKRFRDFPQLRSHLFICISFSVSV